MIDEMEQTYAPLEEALKEFRKDKKQLKIVARVSIDFDLVPYKFVDGYYDTNWDGNKERLLTLDFRRDVFMRRKWLVALWNHRLALKHFPNHIWQSYRYYEETTGLDLKMNSIASKYVSAKGAKTKALAQFKAYCKMVSDSGQLFYNQNDDETYQKLQQRVNETYTRFDLAKEELRKTLEEKGVI